MIHILGKTIFNPAPAIEGLSDNFLKNTSILVCNETEVRNKATFMYS